MSKGHVQGMLSVDIMPSFVFLPLSIFESSGSMQYCHKNPQDIWIYVSMRHMVYRPLNIVAEAEENIKKK